MPGAHVLVICLAQRPCECLFKVLTHVGYVITQLSGTADALMHALVFLSDLAHLVGSCHWVARNCASLCSLK